jgi:hypothetical protein
MTCRLADTCGGGSSCWALVGPDPTNRRTEDVLYYYLYGTTAEKCIRSYAIDFIIFYTFSISTVIDLSSRYSCASLSWYCPIEGVPEAI